MRDDYLLALIAVREASRDLDEFTSDDVWPRWGVDPTGDRVNVMGRAFREAKRKGWIEGTERFVQSRREESKGRRIQVWRKRTDQGVLL